MNKIDKPNSELEKDLTSNLLLNKEKSDIVSLIDNNENLNQKEPLSKTEDLFELSGKNYESKDIENINLLKKTSLFYWKRNFLIVIIVFLIGMGSSFYYFNISIIGSNRLVETKNLIIDPFSEIQLKTSGNIYITQGKETSLKIRTDDNILANLETLVSYGKLVIKPKSFKILKPKQPIDIYVTMQDVRKLSIFGSGRIDSSNPLKVANLYLNIIGSGNINLNIDVEKLETDISGAGNVFLKGIASNHICTISGSGSLRADDLESDKSNIIISGAGISDVWVQKNLDIKISGSGNVLYKGNPQVSKIISGTGWVRKK